GKNLAACRLESRRNGRLESLRYGPAAADSVQVSIIQARPAPMNSAALNDFAARVGGQLFGHILPFWCGPALDHENGGWMGWLSNDLKPDRTQPKGLIVNSRILWAFSAVHQARPEKLFRQMADRAFDYVMNHFW